MMQNALFTAFLAQVWFALLAVAAPLAEASVAAAGHGNAWQYGTGGGILGLIVLVLDVIVFIEVFKSNRPPASKVIWSLVVFIFPIVGMVIYYLFSNRAAHNSGAGYEPLA
jgi:D-alanyl-lipoteichoic acid acyltransferase DltB (MBOAT superfamily)